jgi:hypothetical protein
MTCPNSPPCPHPLAVHDGPFVQCVHGDCTSVTPFSPPDGFTEPVVDSPAAPDPGNTG